MPVTDKENIIKRSILEEGGAGEISDGHFLTSHRTYLAVFTNKQSKNFFLHNMLCL